MLRLGDRLSWLALLVFYTCACSLSTEPVEKLKEYELTVQCPQLFRVVIFKGHATEQPDRSWRTPGDLLDTWHNPLVHPVFLLFIFDTTRVYRTKRYVAITPFDTLWAQRPGVWTGSSKIWCDRLFDAPPFLVSGRTTLVEQ